MGGIFFLGTPHRGSSQTQLPLVLTSIANLALGGTMRTDLIKSLQKDSLVLKDIATNFRNQTRHIRIASFVEQEKTPPALARVRSYIIWLAYFSFKLMRCDRLLMKSAALWTFLERGLCPCWATIIEPCADLTIKIVEVIKWSWEYFWIGLRSWVTVSNIFLSLWCYENINLEPFWLTSLMTFK